MYIPTIGKSTARFLRFLYCHHFIFVGIISCQHCCVSLTEAYTQTKTLFYLIFPTVSSFDCRESSIRLLKHFADAGWLEVRVGGETRHEKCDLSWLMKGKAKAKYFSRNSSREMTEICLKQALKQQSQRTHIVNKQKSAFFAINYRLISM